MPSIPRSSKMILAAYFLAKFCELAASGRRHPPVEIGVNSWLEAYGRLFHQLADGREFHVFRGSLNQDRLHYLRCLAGKKTDSDARQDVLREWIDRSRAEVWAEVSQFMEP